MRKMQAPGFRIRRMTDDFLCNYFAQIRGGFGRRYRYGPRGTRPNLRIQIRTGVEAKAIRTFQKS